MCLQHDHQATDSLLLLVIYIIWVKLSKINCDAVVSAINWPANYKVCVCMKRIVQIFWRWKTRNIKWNGQSLRTQAHTNTAQEDAIFALKKKCWYWNQTRKACWTKDLNYSLHADIHIIIRWPADCGHYSITVNFRQFDPYYVNE